MQFLNFHMDGTHLVTAYHNFALHDQFTLQGYQYDTPQRRLEIVLKGLVGWPQATVTQWLSTELTLIFRQVTFLRLQETPFDEANVCLLQMQFIHQLVQQPELVSQIERLCVPHEIEPIQWRDHLYLAFHWGVELVLAAATAEVQFHQRNHFERRDK